MKKLVIGVTVVMLSAVWSGAALAESRGGGCGLGYLVWKGQKGVLPQVSAATTNGIAGAGFLNSQTVGMTIGTSGCNPDAMVMNESDKAYFAQVNFDHLKRDMARGDGEYLATMATLMGVDDADRTAFYALTRERYTELVRSPETTSAEFLANLDRELAATPSLARYVG